MTWILKAGCRNLFLLKINGTKHFTRLVTKAGP